MLEKAQESTVIDSTFQIDNIFKFTNPPLYSINSSSNVAYLMFYAGFAGLLYLLLIFVFLFTKILFQKTKKETLTEGIKLLINSLSVINLLFLTVFQVPFFIVLFQGFRCGEDSLKEYSMGLI